MCGRGLSVAFRAILNLSCALATKDIPHLVSQLVVKAGLYLLPVIIAGVQGSFTAEFNSFEGTIGHLLAVSDVN
jgi:hypothetical protein